MDYLDQLQAASRERHKGKSGEFYLPAKLKPIKKEPIKMTLKEITTLVRDMNIVEDEENLSFKSAVVLLSGINLDTCCLSKIKKFTGYWWKEVFFIMHNFWANGIIYQYNYNLEGGDDTEQFFEIILCAMAGAGELVRTNEDIITTEKHLSWDEFLERTQYCSGTYTARDMCNMDIDKVRELNNHRKNVRENIFTRATINERPTPIIPTPQPITIDKSTLTISDINFYEVPKGKLSKPKRRYQNRRDALAAFEEKQSRIRQTAAKINATL